MWLKGGAWVGAAALIGVMLVFTGRRIGVDVDNLSSGRTLPDTDFHRRYAEHPVLAYLHIGPGLAYLVVAPVQLSTTVRQRFRRAHRVAGRVAVGAGLVSALFGIVFGLLYPWGGALEASAATVFGAYMALALTEAVRRIRRRDVAGHRRWMIRAFAVSLGVATIRGIIGFGGGARPLHAR